MVVKVAVPRQFKLKIIPDFRGIFFSNQKEIHYIGGSEVLPAPLETEEEWSRKVAETAIENKAV